MESREIKFRSFNHSEKIMADVTSLHCDGGVHVEYKKGEPKSGHFFGGNWVGDDWRKGEHHLMQYSCLKDIDKKEIYEGDILSNEINCKGVVKFSKGKFKCFMTYAEKQEVAFELVNVNEVTKVIGNIYENPELLPS